MLRRLEQTGSTLLGLIIIMPFLILITALYMDLTVSSFRTARGDQMRSHAQLATDGGIDAAMEEISLDEDWAGTSGEIELHNDGKVRTTYQVVVTAVDEDTKTLLSTGRTYSPVGATTPSATVKVNVDLRPVSSGEYSVVSGVGGLIMSNSSKILGGNVFINGTISLTNTAQIGLTTSPVTVDVAHNVCPNPADATYPRICNSGENGQPITISNSAHIYGNVRANNQTNGSNMSDPGLTASSGITAQALPDHDRDAQKAAITTNITGAAASCSSGTRTWAANTKITGNVSVTNSCKVTVEGDVWITGTFSASNSSEVAVSNSLGTTRPVIMVDGTSASFTNSSTLKSNTSNTGFMIINYRSDAACSPDCADVTGNDLFNSRGDERISLSNSSSGPQTIFYARWTKVRVNNSGQIGALIGQTVELSNSSNITFGTSVGTGTQFWVIDGYRRQF